MEMPLRKCDSELKVSYERNRASAGLNTRIRPQGVSMSCVDGGAFLRSVFTTSTAISHPTPTKKTNLMTPNAVDPSVKEPRLPSSPADIILPSYYQSTIVVIRLDFTDLRTWLLEVPYFECRDDASGVYRQRK
eukprot:gb/GECG01015045.1/.p1 GENE.gb/GECG01015045.1/~~gb/GECG01015045.1/.p1  ORF type:complete len:133 (+),score=6.10 gb/GECG01015045.1/:1-399(+)